jgi:DNA-binding transcriptional MerR regulator
MLFSWLRGMTGTILNVPACWKVKPGQHGDDMRIGELAKATGTTPKTLRFYEDTGLLTPAGRTASGYREFTTEAVDRLEFIRRGRAAGLTLAQIREVIHLRDAGTTPCRHVRDLLGSRLADLDRQIAELEALRETVAQLRDEASRADPDACLPEDVCRYL